MLIDGIEYKVVENLGFNQSRNCYAKVVLEGLTERVVTRQQGSKRWSFAKPRIQILGNLIGQN